MKALMGWGMGISHSGVVAGERCSAKYLPNDIRTRRTGDELS